MFETHAHLESFGFRSKSVDKGFIYLNYCLTILMNLKRLIMLAQIPLYLLLDLILWVIMWNPVPLALNFLNILPIYVIIVKQLTMIPNHALMLLLWTVTWVRNVKA